MEAAADCDHAEVSGHGRRPVWQTAAVIAGVVLVVGSYVGRNLVGASAKLDGPSDFAHYHQAAQAVLEGESPYAVRGFLYPPPALLPVMPLARLDEPTARWWWFWISHALILGAAIAVWRSLNGGAAAGTAVLLVWCLAGTVAENLVLGQINPVLLALVAAAMAVPAAASSRAAVAVGAAAAVKIWPGALLAGFLLERRRAFVAGVLAAALLLGGSAAVLVATRPAPHRPAGTGAWAGTPAFLNLSLPATALRLMHPPEDWREMPVSWRGGNQLENVQLSTSDIGLSLATAVGVLAFGLCLLFRGNRSGLPLLPVLAALIAIALAAAPVSWYHYRLLHFPGLAWLACVLIRRGDRSALLGLAASTVVITWSHVAWLEPAGVVSAPAFVFARGLMVPLLEMVLAAWYLREARAPSLS